jgi:predicted secreted hydrolase
LNWCIRVNDDGKKPLAARRRTLACLAGMLISPGAFAQVVSSPVTRHSSPLTSFASVVPGYEIRFPHDEGSHPEFRIEWWYVTGWLETASRRPLGFQITFFRARPDLKHDNPSAFTPRHVLVAHAALSDPVHGRLVQAERAARAGFGLADAEEGRMKVWIDDWSLEGSEGAYHARIPAGRLQFQFLFRPTRPPLIHGENGFSQKGPMPEFASYYYSLPHLEVSGTLLRQGGAQRVNGRAWLDHEWSSSLMAEEAVGWDWIGINLDEGGALMAFRMRDRQGGSFWAAGTRRRPDGNVRVFSPSEVRFIPRREWRSPRTGTRYPVAWSVRTGDLEITIEPLMDDQENDVRASTGTIYWEGAVHALVNGKQVGRGYLELTGYWRRLNL